MSITGRLVLPEISHVSDFEMFASGHFEQMAANLIFVGYADRDI
jgi:hypothetical protein